MECNEQDFGDTLVCRLFCVIESSNLESRLTHGAEPLRLNCTADQGGVEKGRSNSLQRAMRCLRSVLYVLLSTWILRYHKEGAATASASASASATVVHPSRTTPWPWSLFLYHRATEQFKTIQKSVFRPFPPSNGSHDDKRNNMKTTTSYSKKDTVVVDPTTATIRVKVLSPRWARVCYAVTAFYPMLAVLFNDYVRMLGPWRRSVFLPPATTSSNHDHGADDEEEKDHYLAPLGTTDTRVAWFGLVPTIQPRVGFALGALLRGLQLTTALQDAFDPTAGVGFGLNVIGWLAQSQWPAVVVLGWSATKIVWKLLGATPPKESALPVVISMVHREKQNKQQPAAAQGYRLGL